MTKKEDIIKKINELDIERVKLIGRLELLEEQEKEAKKEITPDQTDTSA